MDRRGDKWSNVRTLLNYLDVRNLKIKIIGCINQFQNQSHFAIRVVFILKPDGVLQRAIEMAYNSISEIYQFKVILLINRSINDCISRLWSVKTSANFTNT